MAETFDVIKERRSIRNFTDEPVTDEQLEKVLEAVKWAPSWANTQCWEIVVVKDPDMKNQIQDQVFSKGNPARKSMGAAPVLLVLCAKRNSAGFYKETATTKYGDWFMFDLGLACQNLCLAAHDLGLGTVITGAFDHDKAASLLKLPDSMALVSIIPLGHPAKTPSPPKRREIAEFAHQETF